MASLKTIVSAYLRECRARARKELAWFASRPSFEDTVRVAALAQDWRGKRLAHQRRIPGAVLLQCKERLLSSIAQLRACETFEQLYETVRRTARIRGAGELYCYDTAVRIGAKLGVFPELVYLHAGTRDGAVKLGFNRSQATIHPSELPRELRWLEPQEIEDLLCIYKDQIGGAPLQGPAGCGSHPPAPICYPREIKRSKPVCRGVSSSQLSPAASPRQPNRTMRRGGPFPERTRGRLCHE